MTAERISLIRRGARRVLAASGITAAVLYGWWQAVEGARTEALPDAGPGVTLALGRVALTPLSLQWRPASTDEDQPRLVLAATLENVTSMTQPASFGHPSRLVTVEAVENGQSFGEPGLTLVRDRQALVELQPRMPELVEIAWQAPPGWQPGEVSLTFFRQRFKLEDNLYGRSSWLGYSAIAGMTGTPEAAP